MDYENFPTLRVEVDEGVASVTIGHGEINLMDLAMLADLDRVGRQLEADPAVKVVVLQSANPDFFVAHADINVITQLPAQPPEREEKLGWVHAVLDRFRTMPKATIAKIQGRCRGGGSELALACDMRFAEIGRGVLCQPEVGVGIIPGAGGSVRLPRLVGRGRALEIILGCGDFPAEIGRALRLCEPGAACRRDRLLRELPCASHRGLSSRDNRGGEAGSQHGRGWHRGRTRSRGRDLPGCGAFGAGQATHGCGPRDRHADGNHRKVLLQPCLGTPGRAVIRAVIPR